MSMGSPYILEIGQQYRKRKALGTLPKLAPEDVPPPTMTKDKIRDWYERVQADPWHKSQMPLSSTVMAEISGITPQDGKFWTDLERGARSATFLPVYIPRMEQAIIKIENREVIWKLGYFGIIKGTKQSAGKTLYCWPTEREPARRPRIAPFIDGFNAASRCVSCNGNKWLAVNLYGKQHIVCYKCLPPDQWPSLGALDSGRNLIAEYVERHNAKLHLPEQRMFQQQGIQLRTI